VDGVQGRRERRKLETRHRLGDVAARLFAERGYDAVSMSDVARAAEVSDQTVYNYFPTKPELVLDRADEILERTRGVVASREPTETPADVVRRLVHEDLDRVRTADLTVARGEFPAQCLQSDTLRRYALEFRNDQATAIATAIQATDPAVPFLTALGHASALVAVINATTERIGAAVLAGTVAARDIDQMRLDADIALDELDIWFRDLRARLTARSTRR
jgi:AcrR family transcriptional regulator